MAFDHRGYFYMSAREGDRVRRIYLGKGPAAQALHRRHEQNRIARLEKVAAYRSAELERSVAEDSLARLDELAGLLMRGTLLAAGFHQHARGSWRKRRMSPVQREDGSTFESSDVDKAAAAKSSSQAPTVESNPTTGAESPTEAWTISESELRDLINRAERGDRTVLPALEELLDNRPGLWSYAGDVGRVARLDWIDLLSGGNLLTRQSILRTTAAMKLELTGPDGSPLDRLLADRVICSWLQASQADSAFARLKGGGATIAQLDSMSKSQERTQRSLLKAIETLATVRRLVASTASGPSNPRRPGDGPVSPFEGRNPDEEAATRSGQSADRAKPTRRRRKQSPADDPGGSETLVPAVLRDRMRGLVDSEN